MSSSPRTPSSPLISDDRYLQWLRTHPNLANFDEDRIADQFKARCGYAEFRDEEYERIADGMAEYIYKTFGVCLKTSVLREALREVTL